MVEFTPPLVEFLGRAAYMQLTLFEDLSRAIATAPTVAAKASIGRAAELAITKHRSLADEITTAGSPPADAMEPYTVVIDNFQRITQGDDWQENLMKCYLTAGFLDDFFERLARGLPAEPAKRVAAIYSTGNGEAVLIEELRAAIDANPRVASRLALWGRRLVGDTMLVARSALHYTADHASDQTNIEPVFSELIAAHTRRMDALGLTA